LALYNTKSYRNLKTAGFLNFSFYSFFFLNQRQKILIVIEYSTSETDSEAKIKITQNLVYNSLCSENNPILMQF